MFELQAIDPKVYRQQTRKSTYIIMAIFAVLGLTFARLSLHFLGPYNNNPFVLNMIGALFGLFLTFWIIKQFYLDSDWMKEAMYAWRLKRTLMKISNKMAPLQQAIAEDDPRAVQIMRFYHLGLKQMNQLENNSHALIDMVADMNKIEEKIEAMNLDMNPTHFDEAQLADYPIQNPNQAV